MEKQKNGSLCFRAEKDVFIFEKSNYDNHCQKHENLKNDLFLKEIEKTLLYPDTITVQPKNNKNIHIYYGILKKINNNYNIKLWVLKIPVIKTKKVFYIKTAFDFWSLDWQV